MRFVGRNEWGAEKPKYPLAYVVPSRRRYFVVHHSGAPSSQTVKAIQHWCIHGRGFNDIDYNFLVGQDGTIYEGRGWDAIGAHTTSYNTSGVGICVIGNDELSDAAKRSVRQLYEAYAARCDRRLIVRGHRQLATTGTVCPGGKISEWLKDGMPVEPQHQNRPQAKPRPEKETDMPLSDDDVKRVAAAVWRYEFEAPYTRQRWPAEPRRAMASYLVSGTCFGWDARDAIGYVRQGVDRLAAASLPPDELANLASVLRKGLSDDDRATLAAALTGPAQLGI